MSNSYKTLNSERKRVVVQEFISAKIEGSEGAVPHHNSYIFKLHVNKFSKNAVGHQVKLKYKA